MVSQLGLTGLPFVNVANGCATGGSALISAYNTIRSGAADVVMAIGFDKHPRGAFDPDPAAYGLGQWYGDTGPHAHDAVLRHEDPALHARARHHRQHAGQGGGQGVPQRLAERERLAPQAAVARRRSRRRRCCPTRSRSTCSARRARAAWPWCCAGPTRPPQFTDTPVYLKSAVLRSRPFGSFEVFSPWLPVERGNSPTVAAAAGAFEMAGIGPDEIDVVQVQDTESGAEVMHLAECGFVADGEQEELIQLGETEIGGRLPVNTDGGCLANGEPIGASGLRQVYECVLQLRGGAGERQVPNDPQTAFTHVYGAPGISACTVLSR